MRLLTIVLSLFVFAGMLSPTLRAQELPKAKKYSNVKWYSVSYWKWKPGEAQEASRIIHEHLLPVGKALGRKPIHFHFSSGEWSVVHYFPLDEGPSALEWQVSPDNEKFWVELTKREGGKGKALEVLKKLNELVADVKYDIARLDVSEK